MARALIAGLRSGVPAAEIEVVDPDATILEHLQRTFGCTVSRSIAPTVGDADIVLLAVKPDRIAEICCDLRDRLTSQVVVSIAAGIDTRALSAWLGGYGKVVRAMPNTPALVRYGVTGLFPAAGVDDLDRREVDAVFASVGKAIWLADERLIDAITAVSGSGPAYVFYVIEALTAAGIALGLDAAHAETAAAETFRGAIALLESTRESPSALRERVTSKGGTTAAALAVFDQRDLSGAILDAARSAYARANELREAYGTWGAGGNP